MATINDYRIVVKTFVGNGKQLRPGQPVDTSGFRNVRGLEEGRYLRRPNSEEDFRLIEEAIKEKETVLDTFFTPFFDRTECPSGYEEEVNTASLNDEEPPRRTSKRKGAA